MEGAKVLVIEDNPVDRDLIERIFTRVGAQVITAVNGQLGLRAFYSKRPELVIIDVMMPEVDGWDVCRQIRMLSDTPIIMLTALHQDGDIIRGLELGADDFISKPFSPQVLVARARAAVRRAELLRPVENDINYQDDYLTIDIKKRRIIVNGEAVKLTPKEHRILEYMLQNTDRVLTFDQILENVWGWAYKDSVDYVHVYVSHLRKKLEKDPKNPRYLLNEHGLGYRFVKNPLI